MRLSVTLPVLAKDIGQLGARAHKLLQDTAIVRASALTGWLGLLARFTMLHDFGHSEVLRRRTGVAWPPAGPT